MYEANITKDNPKIWWENKERDLPMNVNRKNVLYQKIRDLFSLLCEAVSFLLAKYCPVPPLSVRDFMPPSHPDYNIKFHNPVKSRHFVISDLIIHNRWYTFLIDVRNYIYYLALSHHPVLLTVPYLVLLQIVELC
ncbi:hypothetical protein CEXT_99611 [Caerostris extrusa]|uniref:Uncharacterized protein n=1 Tax=Caerostris extrusa TaxID=172846 RepID=A0AAV4R880_CAEEX|nr:hypothetical protein CEXT_99611 [Caerostris extrusa]